MHAQATRPAVHACAHSAEPMLFGMDLASGPDMSVEVPVLEITGTLAHNAEVRTRVEGDTPVPVICLDLKHVGPGDRRMHAEQAFAPDQRGMAESIAAGLRKGQRVTFTTLASTLRVAAPAALSITHAEPQ
ncbi:MAG: hypothetical protein F9K35_06985 [Burkholderiaceae bacterium]|nr:MAG: hypothetical protein F9K35_06985 [Burkholderiaceae bacterium]